MNLKFGRDLWQRQSRRVNYKYRTHWPLLHFNNSLCIEVSSSVTIGIRNTKKKSTHDIHTKTKEDCFFLILLRRKVIKNKNEHIAPSKSDTRKIEIH